MSFNDETHIVQMMNQAMWGRHILKTLLSRKGIPATVVIGSSAALIHYYGESSEYFRQRKIHDIDPIVYVDKDYTSKVEELIDILENLTSIGQGSQGADGHHHCLLTPNKVPFDIFVKVKDFDEAPSVWGSPDRVMRAKAEFCSSRISLGIPPRDKDVKDMAEYLRITGYNLQMSIQ